MQNMLPNSPNAEICRNLLGGLEPVCEKRKGSMKNVILILLGAIFWLGFSIAMIIVCQLPFVMIGFTLLTFPALAYFSTYEQVLIIQNDAEKFFRYISPMLADGERPLLVLDGKAFGLNIPSWLENDFFGYSFFIFTTDRLILMTLSGTKLDRKKVADFISQDKLESMTNSIFTCDLYDPSSCKIGGFSTNLLANLTHMKIEIRPVGKEERFVWLMANKRTENGKLLSEIASRLRQRACTP
jgi:hypothetical protein